MELVFTNSANNGTLNECKKLSYCSCKAGAVSSSVCSHRSAVNLWLHDLQRLWPEAEQPNFHTLAKRIGMPESILDVSQLPINVKSLCMIQEKSREKRRRRDRGPAWIFGITEMVTRYNNQELDSTLWTQQESTVTEFNVVLRRHQDEIHGMKYKHFKQGSALIGAVLKDKEEFKIS
mgnify:CR=1 FL=1